MEKRKIIIIYIIFMIIIFVLGYPIGQAYISRYNDGNDLYNSGNYEEAIEKYDKALSGIVPKYKECSIRINYALSICNTVQLDETDQDSIKSAISTYESAIEILTEKQCDTHNENANQLKEDIQKEIDRLKNLKQSEDETKEEEKKEESKQEQKETKTIEQKIQALKEEATKDQRSTEMQFKNYDYNYTPNGKNW